MILYEFLCGIFIPVLALRKTGEHFPSSPAKIFVRRFFSVHIFSKTTQNGDYANKVAIMHTKYFVGMIAIFFNGNRAGRPKKSSSLSH